MQHVWAIGFTIAVTVILMPAVLLSISFCLGWRDFVRRFPAQPIGAVVRKGSFASACFGVIGQYNNCIVWKDDEQFLHLSMLGIFSIGHAPFSIPFAMMELPLDEPTPPRIRMVFEGHRLTLPWAMVEREIAMRRELGVGSLLPADASSESASGDSVPSE